jgi:hypothetical protein
VDAAPSGATASGPLVSRSETLLSEHKAQPSSRISKNAGISTLSHRLRRIDRSLPGETWENDLEVPSIGTSANPPPPVERKTSRQGKIRNFRGLSGNARRIASQLWKNSSSSCEKTGKWVV